MSTKNGQVLRSTYLNKALRAQEQNRSSPLLTQLFILNSLKEGFKVDKKLLGFKVDIAKLYFLQDQTCLVHYLLNCLYL